MKAILAGLVGHKLSAVVASVHLFRGHLKDIPSFVWMYFEGRDPVRFKGASDGWRLEVDSVLPEPFDMAESGENVIRDVSQRTAFRASIGKNLKQAWTIESPQEGVMIGVRFDFGSEEKPFIINWGDELMIWLDYPADFKKDNQSNKIIEIPL